MSVGLEDSLEEGFKDGLVEGTMEGSDDGSSLVYELGTEDSSHQMMDGFLVAVGGKHDFKRSNMLLCIYP